MKKEETIEPQLPVCEKCNQPKIEDPETGDWNCPSCDFKIDYYGDGEDGED